MGKPRAKRTVEIQPPVGGEVLAFGYQNQAPFTTPDALNVRPYDVTELRGRIGVRPGLEKAFAENVGPGEVRMIGTVQWKNTSDVIISTLVVSAAGVTKYSNSSGALAAVTATAGAALSSTQLLHSAELSQKLYIADWDPNATISAAARVPKVYNPADNTLAVLTATAGTVPKGRPAIARYRGRIVLAGLDNSVTASRINDPTDWDAAGADVDDATRPWAIGSGDSFTIGQKTTALIPTNDECMIIACTKSMYILRNDPASGGTMNMLDAMVGIVSHGAWCYVPGGAVVFLSHNGLYMMFGGCADHRVEELSRSRLPLALLNLNPDTFIINLAFNSFSNGVLITVSPVIAPYNTGTVTIVDGVVTLAGGTFPSGAAEDRLVVNGDTYTVATRDSDTQITLDNLTVDVGAGAAYSLVRATTAMQHFFFDWKNRGFWPESYDWSVEPTCMFAWHDFALSGSYDTEYRSWLTVHANGSNPASTAAGLTGNESTVLIGCRDGYLRWHRTDKATDDGNSISSYIVYGPLGFGRGMYDCTIDDVKLTMSADSGDVLMTLLAGPSPEDALNDPQRTATCNFVTIEETVSHWWHPRLLGSDFFVKVSDIDGSIWTLERVSLVISERGLTREG
jgi:hypothetical protein